MGKSATVLVGIALAAGALLTFGVGCHNVPRVAGGARDSAVTAIAPVYGAAKDTTRALAKADTSEEEGSKSQLKGFYEEYIASYTEPCVIDSGFKLGTDHYRLYVKDSCLMDSAIVIPKKYVSYYKLDSFVTHNFISWVRLEKNGETILDRVITKKDFTPLLDVSLRRYATIMCPGMSLKQDSIRLGYSISIPLTDVGQQKYVMIDAGGKLTFREPEAND